jgi:hypothetical protein
MDSGFDMLIPVLRCAHPHCSASHALRMNAPTQEASVTVVGTWEAFKDHKKMQAMCEGSTFNLTGESVVRNFIHNCREAVHILHQFNLEHHNPVCDCKWLPDQLTSTVQGFFTGGSHQICCSKTVAMGANPPSLHPLLALTFLKQRGETSMHVVRHVVKTPLKEGSFELGCTLRDLGP